MRRLIVGPGKVLQLGTVIHLGGVVIYMYVYHIRLMFRGGFSFMYFASRWPFVKLNPVKIRFSTSGNEAHTPIREIKNRESFVKPTFAHFHEIKSPRNMTYMVLYWLTLNVHPTGV